MSVQRCLRKLRSTGVLLTSVFLGGLTAWAPPAFTHHSFASVYTADGEEAIQVLEGSVRVFKILNPHGALIVNVTNDAGETEGWLSGMRPHQG